MFKAYEQLLCEVVEVGVVAATITWEGLFGIAVVKTFYNVCMYGVEIRALGSLLSCIQKTCEGLVCLVTNGTV